MLMYWVRMEESKVMTSNTINVVDRQVGSSSNLGNDELLGCDGC